MRILWLWFWIGFAIAFLFLPRCAHGSVTVAAYGAKGDGFTDDAPAFQQALSSGQEVRVARGTYALRTTLNIEPGMTLIGENNPTLLVGPQPTFVVSSSYDWVTIQGFTINCQGQGANVFTFEPGTYEVRINNCVLINGHSAFVQAGGAVGAIYCTGDLMAQMSGAIWDFAAGAGSGLYIEGCTVIPNLPSIPSVYAIGYGGIYIKGFDQYEYPNVPKNGGWAFEFYNCYSIYIDRVVLDGLNTGGFLFSNCFNINGTGIVSWGCYGSGLEAIVSQRGSFSGCAFNYSQSSGVILDGCQMLAFTGTELIGNSGFGALMTGGSSSNTFSGSAAQYNAFGGVYADSEGNTIQ